MNIRAKIFSGASAAEEPILKTKAPRGAKAEELHSVQVPRVETRRSNNRHEDRHRLSDEIVRVSHNDASHDVQLINLSGGGAMIAGSFEAMLWDRVDLHLGDHGTVECAVRWVRDGRFGLEFAHETRLECSDDERAGVLREVIVRSFPELDFRDDVRASDDRQASEGNSHNRSQHRHPLIWSGVLHHDYQSTPVRVRNISAMGAMIETGTPVRVGAEPLLELNDMASVSATVAWTIGDQVGLRFHDRFDMGLLANSRPEVTPTSWVRPAYLDKARVTDSPWDPRWKRLSVTELKEELEGFMKH